MWCDENEYIDLIYNDIMEKTYVLRYVMIFVFALLIVSGAVMIALYDIVIGAVIMILFIILLSAMLTTFYVLTSKKALKSRKKVIHYSINLQENVLTTHLVYTSGENINTYVVSEIDSIVVHKNYLEIICEKNRKILATKTQEFWYEIGNFLVSNMVNLINKE